MPNRISLGIVNYNGGQYLRKCVISALSQDVAVDVLVYDNASTDGSLEAVTGLERVACIRGTANRGYAYACNRLIEAMSGEFCATANMDLAFDPSWARQVCTAFDMHPDVDSVASMVLEQTDPPTVNFAGIGFFPDLHPQSIYAGARPEDAPKEPMPVFGAYGAAMVFRRPLFDRIGLFDEDYFLFYEETEFYWRMNLYGCKTLFWPQARVMHHRSLTTRRFSPLKLFYAERNRTYTGLKVLPFRCYPGLYLWSIYRLILARRRSGSEQKAKMREGGASPLRITLTIAAAWLSALRCLPAIMEKRRELWSRSGADPRRSVEILNRYRVPWSVLSLK